MPELSVSRPSEWRALLELLNHASRRPAGLLVEGAAGIGKSTLLASGIDEARARGFQVMSAQSSATESLLAHAALTDMLRGLRPSAFADLPDVQRAAVDRALIRVDGDGRATDQGEVAAAFVTIVRRLAERSPVLMVMDDLQWLDASSRKVVAYTARRFTGRMGLLAALRTEAAGDSAAWLQMSPPSALVRIDLAPMKLGTLHAVVAERLGRSLSRPTMVRIAEASGGNPFYALELARASPPDSTGTTLQFSRTLAELVQSRIGRLDFDVRATLLAAACVAAPTVDLVAAATNDDAEHVFELLQQAELEAIVTITGRQIRFDHPLLAMGVYRAASTARRRAMHRRLAEIVERPELRARHLGLSAPHGDEETLHALDAAADMACVRGAPATAAELLDFAADIGGDTPERRLNAARCHFSAGDAARARALLEQSMATPGRISAAALSLLGVMEILEGSLVAAADYLERALDECGDEPAMRLQILVPLSLALFNAGRSSAAAHRGDEAVRLATEFGDDQLTSQALSMRALLGCWMGRGINESTVQRAVELEDESIAASVITSPTMHRAMLLAFGGRLNDAHDAMTSMSRRCSERGAESEHVFVAFHQVLLDIWRGQFAEADAVARDATERANLLDGDLPRGVAFGMRATVDAYLGRTDESRANAARALSTVTPSGSFVLTAWPMFALGFLEVSLGNHSAALAALDPLLTTFRPQATEIFIAAFVPDAVECLVGLDRLDEAEPLVEALERNGAQLDRPWMLAVGARCRAMVLAARGDITAAGRAVDTAMEHHARLPMPFERARTQVLLGRLQRRQRQKDAATVTLTEAAAAFDRMGAVLWVERARAELARADVAHAGADELTPSEQRVAELAAGGMSNRDIAKALFISPKTVETNLARVYRKLDIHSRTLLVRHIKPSDS